MSLTLISSLDQSVLRNIKNLAPLLDRVLVQRIKPEAKTASGIFLPESSVKEQNEAKVLAVGPGAVDRNGQRIPMSVSAGDKVLIPQVRIGSFWMLYLRADPMHSRYWISLSMKWLTDLALQFGGNPIKLGEEEYTLFRDSEYVPL
jgi:co-chaperonin GroES (HSP10)